MNHQNSPAKHALNPSFIESERRLASAFKIRRAPKFDRSRHSDSDAGAPGKAKVTSPRRVPIGSKHTTMGYGNAPMIPRGRTPDYPGSANEPFHTRVACAHQHFKKAVHIRWCVAAGSAIERGTDPMAAWCNRQSMPRQNSRQTESSQISPSTKAKRDHCADVI